MTIEQKKELLLLLQEKQKRLVKKDYLEYCKYVHKDNYAVGKHIKMICTKVQQLVEGDLEQNILILSIPPQHGKTLTVTETLPSWFLGKYPNKRVIEVSYGDDLARAFGRRNKQKIEEHGKYLFDISLASNSRSDTEFEISGKRGGMVSRGIMAGVTGKPADLIIIDKLLGLSM